MNKVQLREKLRLEQSSRSLADVENLSRTIANRTIDFVEWGNVKNMHCYTPVQSKNEVSTWGLLEHAWLKYPQITVYLPAKPADNPEYGYQVDKDSLLFTDSMGLSFPESQPELLPQLDVIIVPMLGFNRRLFRLGQGGGFYDKFLKTQKSALKIGLAWEESLIENLPVENHDVAMDIIITQKHLRKNKQQDKN